MKENALVAMEESQMIAVLKSSLYPEAKENSIKMVLAYCKARGLDPLQKPVHIVPMYNSRTKSYEDVIMPGLNLYRTQAAESGLLAGISEPEFGPTVEFKFDGDTFKAPEYARVCVKRLMKNGMVAEFSAIEYFDEAVSLVPKERGDKSSPKVPTAIWRKRPRGMLAKTAESQALRKAFPDISGSQETAEEMEGKSYFEDTSAPATPQTTPQNEAVLEAAYNAANQGRKSFCNWWKGATMEQRAMVKDAYPDTLKSVCEKAELRATAEEVAGV